MFNPIRSQLGSPAEQSGFNPMAAGKKVYGAGRPMPTTGRVQSKAGYGMRDGKMAARREALMRRAGGKPNGPTG